MQEYSRYARQLVLKEIGREGQRRLGGAHVAVVGIGALGSVSANLLARAGVGRLTLIDRDYLEMNNLQRQVLYDEADLASNLPKAVAAKRKLEQINSEIKIEAEAADINADTIDGLLEEADLVVDGTDNLETRFLINDYCLKKKFPWIYGGAVRTEGMSYVILPGDGPCLRCLFGEAPGPENIQTCDQVGILAPTAHMIASFQTIEAIKILSGHKKSVDRQLWKVDLWNRQFKAINLDHLRKTPCSGCSKKDYPYLKREVGSRAVSLCGRNAVQIYKRGEAKINFAALAKKLAADGQVSFNDYLLKYQKKPYEITVFSNGRAIVKGTEDEKQARSLYAKYIGV
jgi:molybdopterin/thiamine biosynthesis adenylyltransferase